MKWWIEWWMNELTSELFTKNLIYRTPWKYLDEWVKGWINNEWMNYQLMNYSLKTSYKESLECVNKWSY